MSGVLSLDTQIVLFAAAARLSAAERACLTATSGPYQTSCCGNTKLHRDGTINLSLNHPALSAILGRITVSPITREIALATRQLDFQTDPADQLIAATSIAHDTPLVTRDQKILGSKVVFLALR